MTKKLFVCLALAGWFSSGIGQAATFNNITNWVGNGTNQAGFEIDWNDGTTNAAHIWGYRWNGTATGEQMLDAIVAADPQLYAEVSIPDRFGGLGTAVFGFGLHVSGDQNFQLNPALTFDGQHLAYCNDTGVDDNRTAIIAGDRWQEGWFTAGYWTYYVSTEDRLTYDFTDWNYSSLGMSSRVLSDGDWDGWSFADGFSSAVPSDPFPTPPAPESTVPHPVVRLVKAFNYNDGQSPYAGLTLNRNILYGTTYLGGDAGDGVVFSVQTDGGNFTNLYSFPEGGDGRLSAGELVFSSNVLYGTTSDQGAGGHGTIFSITTTGTNYLTLHSFTATPNSTNADGATPFCGVLLVGDTLYGANSAGGAFGSGNLFAVNTNGIAFTNLHDFTAPDDNGYNSDGAYPSVDLTYADGFIYGVAPHAGLNNNGDIFKVSTNGTGFTVLHSFNDAVDFDGSTPYGRLLYTNGVLYGTASYGGANGSGTVFSLNADGTGFTKLYEFSAVSGIHSGNADGSNPIGNLALNGHTLYGVTQYGGRAGTGAIYQINTDGSGFYSLYNFPQLDTSTYTNSVGANPPAGLIQSGNSLYGTAANGGPAGYGTMFALDLPNPALNISVTNNQVTINWPIWAQNYQLFTTADLSSGNWAPLTAAVVGTNCIFSGSLNNTAGFFRLQQQ